MFADFFFNEIFFSLEFKNDQNFELSSLLLLTSLLLSLPGVSYRIVCLQLLFMDHKRNEFKRDAERLFICIIRRKLFFLQSFDFRFRYEIHQELFSLQFPFPLVKVE